MQGVMKDRRERGMKRSRWIIMTLHCVNVCVCISTFPPLFLIMPLFSSYVNYESYIWHRHGCLMYFGTCTNRITCTRASKLSSGNNEKANILECQKNQIVLSVSWKHPFEVLDHVCMIASYHFWTIVSRSCILRLSCSSTSQVLC